MCFAIGRSTRLYIGVSRFDRDGSDWVGGRHPFEGMLYEKKTAFEVGGFGTKVLRPSGIFVSGRVQGLPFVVRTYLFCWMFSGDHGFGYFRRRVLVQTHTR